MCVSVSSTPAMLLLQARRVWEAGRELAVPPVVRRAAASLHARYLARRPTATATAMAMATATPTATATSATASCSS